MTESYPWYNELSQYVEGRLKYLSASGEKLALDQEEVNTLINGIVTFTRDQMKAAFSAGHALGAVSNIPKDQEYDFNESLDNFHSASKFDSWVKDYEDR